MKSSTVVRSVHSVLDHQFYALAADHELHFGVDERWTTETFDIPKDDRLLGTFKSVGAESVILLRREPAVDKSIGNARAVQAVIRIDWADVYKRLDIEILASTPELRDEVFAAYLKLYPKLELKRDEPRIQINVWANSGRGPVSYMRVLDAQTYEEIKDNYTKSVSDILGRLAVWTPPSDANGKLILWHGAPGTGKTWAVRMLAKEWKPWCNINFISDPEQFFGSDPNYLFQVAMGDEDVRGLFETREDDEDSVVVDHTAVAKERKWRLLVLEDAGELLSEDAKQRSGQGLSRFLNLTDGLLGQGLRTLVLVTTNEPMEHLHEAVRRPGRCLAAVNFKPFTSSEARTWLSKHGYEGSAKGSDKLSELYDVITPRQLAGDSGIAPIGFTHA